LINAALVVPGCGNSGYYQNFPVCGSGITTSSTASFQFDVGATLKYKVMAASDPILAADLKARAQAIPANKVSVEEELLSIRQQNSHTGFKTN